MPRERAVIRPGRRPDDGFGPLRVGAEGGDTTLRVSGSATATRRDRLVGSATIAAGLLYSCFVVTPFLGASLDPGRSFVSELAALDQPYGGVFRAVDVVVGAIVVLVALRVARCGRVPAVRGAGGALALFGVATVVDVAVPMACAPSAEPACAAAEAARTPLEFGVHEASSVAANGGIIVAVVLLAVARSRGRTASQQASPLELAMLIGLPLIAGPGMVIVVEETLGLGLDGVVGYVQRVQVLALSGVLVTIGAVSWRGSRWVRGPA
ncbi:hypothetical protein GCM10023199_06920 [Actinomycetospora chibensis]